MDTNLHNKSAGRISPRGGWLFSVLKGALIGTGAILPGISGGVLCVVFGIYRPIMALLAHPIRELKKQFWFFVPIVIGFAIGVLGISKLLGWVLTEAETPAIWLFIGLIAGTMPALWKDAGVQGRTKGHLITGVLAFVAMLAFLLYMKASGSVTITPSLGMWLLCGVLWGLGFIAPGLSPSSLFFFFGVMEPMMAGIGALSLPVLLPMGFGLIVCVLVFSRAVEWLLRTRYGYAMHAVLGLAVASTIAIVPLKPIARWTDILIYGLCFAVGFVVALWMDRMNQKLAASGQKE